VTVKRTPSRSFSMTCNVGEALLWEGYLLNLSSNCKGQREDLPAPRLEQSIEELTWRLCNRNTDQLASALCGNLPCHAFPSCGWPLALSTSFGDVGGDLPTLGRHGVE